MVAMIRAEPIMSSEDSRKRLRSSSTGDGDGKVAASNGSNGKGSDCQFPGRLHDMLNYIEKEGLSSVVSWAKGGEAFSVNDADKLVEILPKFFGQTKYRSFQRQLNMWCFTRISTDACKHGRTFQHPFFIRGRKDLCRQMSRHMFKSETAEKPKASRKSREAREEPEQDAVVVDPVGSDGLIAVGQSVITNASISRSCDANEKLPVNNRHRDDDKEEAQYRYDRRATRHASNYYGYDRKRTPASSDHQPRRSSHDDDYYNRHPHGGGYYAPSYRTGSSYSYDSNHRRRRSEEQRPRSRDVEDGDRVDFEGRSFYFLDPENAKRRR